MAGYTAADDTWEDATNILDVRLIDEFEGRDIVGVQMPPAIGGGSSNSGSCCCCSGRRQRRSIRLQPVALPLLPGMRSSVPPSRSREGARDQPARVGGGAVTTEEEEEDDDDDDDDESDTAGLCGMFGCTLPDKHQACTRSPSRGASGRRATPAFLTTGATAARKLVANTTRLPSLAEGSSAGGGGGFARRAGGMVLSNKLYSPTSPGAMGSPDPNCACWASTAGTCSLRGLTVHGRRGNNWRPPWSAPTRRAASARHAPRRRRRRRR